MTTPTVTNRGLTPLEQSVFTWSRVLVCVLHDRHQWSSEAEALALALDGLGLLPERVRQGWLRDDA